MTICSKKMVMVGCRKERTYRFSCINSINKVHVCSKWLAVGEEEANTDVNFTCKIQIR